MLRSSGRVLVAGLVADLGLNASTGFMYLPLLGETSKDTDTMWLREV